jgi:class 3 adenylate cyclase
LRASAETTAWPRKQSRLIGGEPGEGQTAYVVRLRVGWAAMAVPETRYARRSDGVNIGYQMLGSGPATLVWCWGWMSHLDLQWADAALARWFERLAGFCRLVIYDKAGTGVSDPISHVATLEERVEDVRVVMDDARIEHAAILGESEAGPVAALFAATYPRRTDALIIYGSLATGRPDDDELAAYGGRPGETANLLEHLHDSLDHWGEGRTAEWIAPSILSPVVRRAFGRMERSAVSPGMARGLIDALLSIDVRPALAAISAPTIVLHRSGDVVPIAHGRLLADRIPGARMVELSGSDHAIWTEDADVIVGEIEQLLTGSRATPEPDRVLATVLFTDIVDSTRNAAEVGDAAWRRLLEQHDELVREEVAKAGGRVVKSLGDGVLAVFTGPARAIACAQALLSGVAELGLSLRAGVHSGECEVLGDDLGGMAVHIGARVGALAEAGQILVSQTVVDLVVGSGLQFSDRGEQELRGVPGAWRLFAVSVDSNDQRTQVEPPRDYMTGADRLTIRLARRAPRAMQTLGRLAQRGGRPAGTHSG